MRHSDTPSSAPLACPVRGCARPLAPVGSSWKCALGHTFDVARSGYLNLLQPQDRRSKAAGDTTAAIEARSRLLAASVGRGLIDAIAAMVKHLLSTEGPVVADLGCGGGEFLDALSGVDGLTGIGIDLAPDAVTRAARSIPGFTWIVANADRRLPLLDGSVDVVTSIHARRNPAECARVLRPGGRLVVAVPAGDDLVELREAIFGRSVERARVEPVVTEHSEYFAVGSIEEHREQATLDATQVGDLLTGTYRGARHATRDQRDALGGMTVTLASHIILFQLATSTRARP